MTLAMMNIDDTNDNEEHYEVKKLEHDEDDNNKN